MIDIEALGAWVDLAAMHMFAREAIPLSPPGVPSVLAEDVALAGLLVETLESGGLVRRGDDLVEVADLTFVELVSLIEGDLASIRELAAEGGGPS